MHQKNISTPKQISKKILYFQAIKVKTNPDKLITIKGLVHIAIC